MWIVHINSYVSVSPTSNNHRLKYGDLGSYNCLANGVTISQIYC